MARKSEHRLYLCSFCGKSQNHVHRLIAGPNGVCICDECVTLCNEVLAADLPIELNPQNDETWRMETHDQ
jgi:ATP-dependent Clp protease ATP-binding subunit ClpX